MPNISDLLPSNTEVTELSAKYTTKSPLDMYKLLQYENEGKEKTKERNKNVTLFVLYYFYTL
jgi:hypothetical protein